MGKYQQKLNTQKTKKKADTHTYTKKKSIRCKLQKLTIQRICARIIKKNS